MIQEIQIFKDVHVYSNKTNEYLNHYNFDRDRGDNWYTVHIFPNIPNMYTKKIPI